MKVGLYKRREKEVILVVFVFVQATCRMDKCFVSCLVLD